jgi:DnaJ-class molecular chaperone
MQLISDKLRDLYRLPEYVTCDRCVGTGMLVYGSDTFVGNESCVCFKCKGTGVMRGEEDEPINKEGD